MQLLISPFYYYSGRYSFQSRDDNDDINDVLVMVVQLRDGVVKMVTEIGKRT
jgi:hypothetical protein